MVHTEFFWNAFRFTDCSRVKKYHWLIMQYSLSTFAWEGFVFCRSQHYEHETIFGNHQSLSIEQLNQFFYLTCFISLTISIFLEKTKINDKCFFSECHLCSVKETTWKEMLLERNGLAIQTPVLPDYNLNLLCLYHN